MMLGRMLVATLSEPVGFPLPAGLGRTLAMLVIGVGAGICVRGLRAPRVRPQAVLGLTLAFLAAGLVVVAAFRERAGTFALVGYAFAAVVGGLAHSVYFGFAPLPERWPLSRAATARLGWIVGLGTVLALLSVGASGAALGALALIWVWIGTASARRAPEQVLRGETWLPAVRFPCPRCGVVADWGDAVTPCPACGLFVHLVWDPEGGEPATFAPEDPQPGTFARFHCLGCRNEVDWMRGTTACAVCGKRLRLHWNTHATGQDTRERDGSLGAPT